MPVEPHTHSGGVVCPRVGLAELPRWTEHRETILHTNRPSTEMGVIGGPVCTQQGEIRRAYWWWNLRMHNRRESWPAEALLYFTNYFLEPVR